MGILVRRAGYLHRILTKTSSHRTFLIVGLVFLQIAFGTYYSWTEFQKGAHFNPFLSPTEFQQNILLPIVRADVPEGDIQAYVKAAHSIATRGNYTLESGLASAWVTPGYPLFLALFFSLFGFHFGAVLLLNALATGVSLWAIGKITESLALSRNQSLLAILLFAGNIRLGMFVGYVYTECLFVAFVSTFLFVYFRALNSERISLKSTVLLGVLAGYGILIRPVFLGVAPLLLVGGVLYSIRKWRFTGKIVTLRWLLALGIAALPIGFWIYRNTTQIGYPVISTSSALAKAEGNQDYYLSRPIFTPFKGAPNQRPFGAVNSNEFHSHPELNLFLAAENWTKNWKQNHSIAQKFHTLLQRMVALLSPYILDIAPRNRAISSFYWLLIFPTSIVGLYQLRKKPLAWMLFASCLALILLPSLVVVGTSQRYQIPGQVLLSPLTAIGLICLFRKMTKAKNET